MGVNYHRTLANETRRNTQDPVAREIRRVWGDMDVVDAKADLRVFIQAEDIKRATRKDPALCVFAQACRRAFRAKKVLFFRSVAYVELPDDKGRRKVERFIMAGSTREIIDRWDRGEDIIPEGGFLLKAPTPSNTMDGQLANQRKWSGGAAGSCRMIAGEMVATEGGSRADDPDCPVAAAAAADATPAGIGQGKGRFRDEPRLIDVEANPVRNGMGSVHFTPAGMKLVRTAGLETAPIAPAKAKRR